MKLTSRETVNLYRNHLGFQVIAFCGATRVQYCQIGNTQIGSVSRGPKSHERNWPFLENPSDTEIIETAVRHARIADGVPERCEQTGETT